MMWRPTLWAMVLLKRKMINCEQLVSELETFWAKLFYHIHFINFFFSLLLMLIFFSFFTFVYSRMWRIYYAGGKYSAKVAKGTCGYRLDLTQGWQMIFHRVSRQIVVRLTEDLVRLNVVLNLLIILNLSSKCVKKNHSLLCYYFIYFTFDICWNL